MTLWYHLCLALNPKTKSN